MQISLNMGDLVVPSPLTTPIEGRPLSWPSQAALPISSYFGPTQSRESYSGKDTPCDIHGREPHGFERRGSVDTVITIDEAIAEVKAKKVAAHQHRMPILYPTLSKIEDASPVTGARLHKTWSNAYQ